MDLARYTALFVSESRDHLQRCNELLLAWERAPTEAAPVPELFRALHSIKGSAATLGLGEVAGLAHAAEHLLDAIRSGAVGGSAEVVQVLFRSVDLLGAGVEAVERGEQAPAAPDLIGELTRLAGHTAVQRPAARAAPRAVGASAKADHPTRRGSRQIRVDLPRLDALVQDVGNLVVTQNRLLALTDRDPGSELHQLSTRISSIVTGLQAGVLRARMSPVAEVFERFPRMVRDLARDLGKSVRLELRGGDIELDRSVLDALGDPLVHLVRNAIDHGLERPEDREAGGKPAEGSIRLTAERARGEAVIRVEDDGRGIDRGAVRERALRLGLLDPDAPLPDDPQLLRLLAHSGFTLKAQVTELSGRGVGVDAVLARIRALGGRMELMTATGKGTTFLLTIPLTRVIVRALLVEADRARYAIPFGVLTEAGLNDDPSGSVTFRGEALPSADLCRVVGGPPPDGARRPMVVLDAGGRRGALLVDALLGQQDVVVEQFAAPAGLPPWVNGATILPDGAPALILDPTALF